MQIQRQTLLRSTEESPKDERYELVWATCTGLRGSDRARGRNRLRHSPRRDIRSVEGRGAELGLAWNEFSNSVVDASNFSDSEVVRRDTAIERLQACMKQRRQRMCYESQTAGCFHRIRVVVRRERLDGAGGAASDAARDERLNRRVVRVQRLYCHQLTDLASLIQPEVPISQPPRVSIPLWSLSVRRPITIGSVPSESKT